MSLAAPTHTESLAQPLTALVYLSRAHDWVTDQDIQIILDHARRMNAARGVTGVLLYRDRTFLQLLEGAERDVQAIWEIIRRDRRHRDLTLLEHGPHAQRLFSDWTMGFRNLDEAKDSEPLKKVLPFFDPKNPHSPSNAELLKKALLTFRYL
jgi:hypothetical protein